MLHRERPMPFPIIYILGDWLVKFICMYFWCRYSGVCHMASPVAFMTPSIRNPEAPIHRPRTKPQPVTNPLATNRFHSYILIHLSSFDQLHIDSLEFLWSTSESRHMYPLMTEPMCLMTEPIGKTAVATATPRSYAYSSSSLRSFGWLTASCLFPLEVLFKRREIGFFKRAIARSNQSHGRYCEAITSSYIPMDSTELKIHYVSTPPP